MEAGSNGLSAASGLPTWPLSWLVGENREMETIRWGNDDTEYYIIYEEEQEHG